MKRPTLRILIPAALCVVLIALLLSGRLFGRRPFANLAADGVLRTEITLRPPDETLTVEDRETLGKLAGILNRVTIYESNPDPEPLAGQWVEFVLHMRDGSVVSVAAFNPYLVVDSVWYRTEYEPCEALNSLANSLRHER